MNTGKVSYRVVRESDKRMIGTVGLTLSQLAQAERLSRDGNIITRLTMPDVIDPLKHDKPIIRYWPGRQTDIDDDTPIAIELA